MANSSVRFGCYIHHGGYFAHIDGEDHYVGGCLVPRHDLWVNQFSYFDLESEILDLGYVSWNVIYYRFPHFMSSYKKIITEEDVTEMLGCLGENCQVINIYVDAGVLHGSNNVGGHGSVGEGATEGVDDASGHGSVGGAAREGDDDAVGHGSVGGAAREGGNEIDSESEDSDYIPPQDSDYTDDDLDDDELCSDEEYVEARKILRDKSDKGFCDEVFGKVGHECGLSDYESSDGDIDSSETDEEEISNRRKNKRPVYDPRCDHKTMKLEVGMRFEDGFVARDAIRANAIEDGREIRFKRVSKVQMEAKCIEPCPWRCYGSVVSSTGHFIIKTLKEPHTCTLAIRNKQVSSAWIAKNYLNVFRYRPEISVKELASDLLRRFNVHVTRWKLYHARDKAIEMLRGTVEEHYAKLRSYILELQRVDNEGRFRLNLAEGAVFKGIYIGFSALRKGFQSGCRRVIGLDGAFLKTYLGGFYFVQLPLMETKRCSLFLGPL